MAGSRRFGPFGDPIGAEQLGLARLSGQILGPARPQVVVAIGDHDGVRGRLPLLENDEGVLGPMDGGQPAADIPTDDVTARSRVDPVQSRADAEPSGRISAEHRGAQDSGLALDRRRFREVGSGLIAVWAGQRTAFIDIAGGKLIMMPHCSRLVDDGSRLWCNETDGASA